MLMFRAPAGDSPAPDLYEPEGWQPGLRIWERDCESKALRFVAVDFRLLMMPGMHFDLRIIERRRQK